MSARAPVALLQPAERLAKPATARALARARIVTAAAGSVVVRRPLVVAQPEEPNEPDHEEAHIEDAEANHEDPPLRGHQRDGSAGTASVEGPFSRLLALLRRCGRRRRRIR